MTRRHKQRAARHLRRQDRRFEECQSTTCHLCDWSNPEVIKAEYLSQAAQVSRFDLKRDSCTGYLVIVEKSTQRVVEVTHYQMGSG
jgi:hypothetical protein